MNTPPDERKVLPGQKVHWLRPNAVTNQLLWVRCIYEWVIEIPEKGSTTEAGHGAVMNVLRSRFIAHLGEDTFNSETMCKMHSPCTCRWGRAGGLGRAVSKAPLGGFDERQPERLAAWLPSPQAANLKRLQTKGFCFNSQSMLSMIMIMQVVRLEENW